MRTDFPLHIVIVLIGIILIIAILYIMQKSRIRKKLQPILGILVVLTVGGLCYFFISKTDAHTEINISPGANLTESAITAGAVSEQKLENCIICKEDEIIIDNAIVDMEALEDYLDYRVENNIQVILVDDYSTAGFVNEIIDYLNKKGVKYVTKDETWLSE